MKLQGDGFPLRRGAVSELDIAWAIWCEANIAAGRGPGSKATLGRIKRRLAFGTTTLFFAVQDGESVGVTMLAQAREKSGDGNPVDGLGHLSTVAVKPAYWGRGIARALVNEALNEARVRKFERVQLWVNAWNARAIRLYEFLGFRQTTDQQLDDYGKLMHRYEISVEL